MRARSKKMAAKYTERRKLVATMLEEFPMCQRCNAQRSTEVHELLSRARGGSILDPSNCVALCHQCHHWITTNPAEATADGWLKHSWEK
jgi:5-methylcytosine-specific restriction endonuclease McrA